MWQWIVGTIAALVIIVIVVKISTRKNSYSEDLNPSNSFMNRLGDIKRACCNKLGMKKHGI